MSNNLLLMEQLQSTVGNAILNSSFEYDEVTVELQPKELLKVCRILNQSPQFHFEQLIDLCAVDYFHYGCSEWNTHDATSKGFERGVRPVQEDNPNSTWTKPRFAVVYHLLSVRDNQRLRLKVFVDDQDPMIASVTSIWSNANWYEREAFDLYGILFEGHPDLRRLLTDYGFIGHPFRKDFPLVGNVEVRYDAQQGRVVYEPVDIVPRTLVPKVIREEEADLAVNETQKGHSNG